MNCLKCGAEIDDFMEVCPGCMAPFCHECDGEGIIDSGGFTPWGAPIGLPCPECAPNRTKRLVAIGASWEKDSSLEKWFPITAEKLKDLQNELATVRNNLNQIIDLVRDIEPWAAHHACNAQTVSGLANHVYKACVQLRPFIYPANSVTDKGTMNLHDIKPG